jgi:hypothetical protein
MKAPDASAIKKVHRLLFRALLDMRSQGGHQADKSVFHLADLFHSVVLEMENAAEGKCTYEEVLKYLEERAKETGCEKWLDANLAQLNAK